MKIVEVVSRKGWWHAIDERGITIVARVSKHQARKEGEEHARIHNEAEAIALRFMSGEIEGRVHAVALIEKIQGVRDSFEASFLLKQHCGEV